jgi:chemotaxis protein MotB
MTHVMRNRWGRVLAGSLVALAATMLGGCVGQGEHDRLFETNRSLQSRNADLERENSELKLALDQIRGGVGRGEATMSELQRRNAELQRQLDQALGDLRSLESRLSSLNFGPVDSETDAALQALAAQYPDLIKYDSARGMLRFASDLTFDSGSAIVKENAKPAIDALAQILNSSAASQYEVVVEGHTDSQRIANPATLREHKTNRHLSAHRAIAVIEQLGSRCVGPTRTLASGWGEHRPAVTNTPSGNTPANRRVEIFLAKSRGGTATDAGTGSSSATPDQGLPPSRPMDITK